MTENKMDEIYLQSENETIKNAKGTGKLDTASLQETEGNGLRRSLSLWQTALP